MAVSLIIMAAGRSRRMNQNKLFLNYDGQTFIERALSLALSVTVEERILVINSADIQRLTIPENMKIVINNQPEKGQSHSVSLGTKAAKGTGYLFLPIDQPLLTVTVLETIIEKASSTNIVMPEYKGSVSSPVYFGQRYRRELIGVKGETGGRSVRDAHSDHWLKVAITEEILQDIDTQEDYLRLIQ